VSKGWENFKIKWRQNMNATVELRKEEENLLNKFSERLREISDKLKKDDEARNFVFQRISEFMLLSRDQIEIECIKYSQLLSFAELLYEHLSNCIDMSSAKNIPHEFFLKMCDKLDNANLKNNEKNNCKRRISDLEKKILLMAESKKEQDKALLEEYKSAKALLAKLEN
jgi:hypothetical protein